MTQDGTNHEKSRKIAGSQKSQMTEDLDICRDHLLWSFGRHISISFSGLPRDTSEKAHQILSFQFCAWSARFCRGAYGASSCGALVGLYFRQNAQNRMVEHERLTSIILQISVCCRGGWGGFGCIICRKSAPAAHFISIYFGTHKTRIFAEPLAIRRDESYMR